MKILHVIEGEVGNRAYKEAYCFKKNDIQNAVLCMGEGDKTMAYIFDEVILANRDDYAETIVDSDADILIFHDRPKSMAPIVERLKKYKDDRPIVFEHYDLWYYLGPQYATYNFDEHYMLAESDLVVQMGKLNQEHSHELYQYHGNEIICMSMTPRDWIPERSERHIGGVVYEGGVSYHEVDEPTQLMQQRKFRDLYDAYWGFRKHGITMDIYAAFNKLVEYPTILGLRFPELLKRLTEYDWGFMGHTEELPIIQKAGPCKVWEYSMAGLPIIAMNMDDVVDQTNKKGIIKCHSVDEAVEIMQSVDHDKLAQESFESCRYLDDEILPYIEALKTLI